MRKCENISPYMSRPLVIYDFAPDLSEFLTFSFFINVGLSAQSLAQVADKEPYKYRQMEKWKNLGKQRPPDFPLNVLFHNGCSVNL
jgi:hypothetical protein